MSRDGYLKTKYVEPFVEGLDAVPTTLRHGKICANSDGTYTVTSNGLTDMIKLLNGAPLLLE